MKDEMHFPLFSKYFSLLIVTHYRDHRIKKYLGAETYSPKAFCVKYYSNNDTLSRRIHNFQMDMMVVPLLPISP